MTRKTEWRIVCNYREEGATVNTCGAAVIGLSSSHVERMAKDLGWKVGRVTYGERDYCPLHASSSEPKPTTENQWRPN